MGRRCANEEPTRSCALGFYLHKGFATCSCWQNHRRLFPALLQAMLSRARALRAAAEARSATAMATRDARIARRQALEAAQSRVYAQQVGRVPANRCRALLDADAFAAASLRRTVSCITATPCLQVRTAEARHGLQTASLEAERLLSALRKRRDALTSAAADLRAEQVRACRILSIAI